MEIESIIEKKCIQLLRKGLHFGASDVHLLPAEKMYKAYFRKYNQLISIGEIPLAVGEKMISHFKYQSALDISEKRRPQSGAFEYHEGEQVISCRVSTLPSVMMKESVVIRLMLQNVALPLSELSFSEQSAKQLQTIVAKKQGIMIFCGATGSGKSTTMYSLVNYCSNQLSKHVISLEDPVENNHQQILQIQVNERSGVTYEVGLKAILRHSPDVIMIGEIRDRETAKIAIEAALTGHLVITTIHAKNSFGSLHRLLDLGISETELRQTVVSIVTQKLITKNTDKRELSALFEIMEEELLNDAFYALKKKEDFVFPLEQSIEKQIVRGVRNEEIIPNILTS